jgi:hypothetical protein
MLTEITLAENLKIAPEVWLVKRIGIVLSFSINSLTVLAIIAFRDNSLNCWNIVIVCVYHQGQSFLFLPDDGSLSCGYHFE